MDLSRLNPWLSAPQTYLHPSPPAFPQFANLPAELRSQIWTLAIHALPARVIILSREQHSSDIDNLADPLNLISTCPIPALLHTCRDSRREALTVYSLAFGVSDTARVDRPALNARGRPYSEWPDRIFIAYDRDIVLVGPSLKGIHLRQVNQSGRSARPVYSRRWLRGASKVRRLALYATSWGEVEQFPMKAWPAVKEVVLVGVAKMLDETGKFVVQAKSPVLKYDATWPTGVVGRYYGGGTGPESMDGWKHLKNADGKGLKLYCGTIEMTGGDLERFCGMSDGWRHVAVKLWSKSSRAGSREILTVIGIVVWLFFCLRLLLQTYGWW